MDKLHRQVAQARRRLIFEQFIVRLAWCLNVALAVAAIGITIQKLAPLAIDGQIWSIAWVVGAIVLAIGVALVWTLADRRDSLFAAIEIDRRFGLKERVSSVLSLKPNELETPAGQALLTDAVRRVENADIAEQFSLPFRRRNLLPLLPALVVFGLTFLADKGRESQAAASVSTQTVAQIHSSAEALGKKLAQQRKEANEKGLKDASDRFQKLEQGIKDLAKKQGLNREQALVQLNDLQKQLESWQKALGNEEKLKQELGQMKDMEAGPADKLAGALKNGRFDRALDELKKMENALKDQKLSAKEKAKMARQFDGMKQALDGMVQRHQQVEESLQKQISQFRNSGRTADAKRLEKQLSQLQQQRPQMHQLEQLAKKCSHCAGAARSGTSTVAANALGEMESQIQELKQQADEQQMITQSIDDIAQSHSEITCSKDAASDSKCDKAGDTQDTENEQVLGEPPGHQLGRETGRQPKLAKDSKFFDSKIAQTIGDGSAIVVGEADGPNKKGRVRAEIQAEIASSKQEDSDPLTGQRLPRSQRDFAKEYFDSVREGN